MRDGVGPVVQLLAPGPRWRSHMLRLPLSTIVATGALALLACNPFRSPMKQDPVVQVSARDANGNSRWQGTRASPSSLAGAVQMTGSISMAPGSSPGNTNVALL